MTQKSRHSTPTEMPYRSFEKSAHGLLLPLAKERTVRSQFPRSPLPIFRSKICPMLISVPAMKCASSPTVSKSSRSEEHTSELQSLMRTSYAVFCLKKKTLKIITLTLHYTIQTQHTQSNTTKKIITPKRV